MMAQRGMFDEPAQLLVLAAASQMCQSSPALDIRWSGTAYHDG
jgi:hypothetical protein